MAPCAYCGQLGGIQWHKLRSGKPSFWVTFDHEIDHIVPEALGGSGEPENLQLARRPCNRSKGAKA